MREGGSPRTLLSICSANEPAGTARLDIKAEASPTEFFASDDGCWAIHRAHHPLFGKTAHPVVAMSYAQLMLAWPRVSAPCVFMELLTKTLCEVRWFAIYAVYRCPHE